MGIFLAYQSDKIGIWILKINKHNKTSLHCHFNKDTTLIILEGCGKISLVDNEEILFNVMNIVNIHKYKFHGISSISDYIIVMENRTF